MAVAHQDNTVLLVRRDAPTQARIVEAAQPAAAAGEVLVELDTFGLTANNLTYAVLGRPLRYFDFFEVPAGYDGTQEACLPVWGMATVRHSRSHDVAVGTRLYGYYPAARYAVLTPAHATPAGFRVERPHLPASHGVYHFYSEPVRDPFYLTTLEDLMVVMRPLFLTGLLLADYFVVSQFLGADTVLMSSAASKTSFGAAAAIAQASGKPVIGLASARSVAQARAFGVYADVIAYDELARLPTGTFLHADVAGSKPLRRALREALGERLVHTTQVGLTHWAEGSYDRSEDKAQRGDVFFAPAWTAKRRAEEGEAFFGSLRSGWQAQMNLARTQFHVTRAQGGAAVLAEFNALVEGRVEPTRAPVFALVQEGLVGASCRSDFSRDTFRRG
jgi:hypothetical protein